MAATSSSPDLASYVRQQQQQLKKRDSNEEAAAGGSLNREGAWAALAFAVVLIVVGLPVWWHTTTVYRALLPYSTVQRLADVQRQHSVPITVMGGTAQEREVFSAQLRMILQATGEVVSYTVQAAALPTQYSTALQAAATLDDAYTVLHNLQHRDSLHPQGHGNTISVNNSSRVSSLVVLLLPRTQTLLGGRGRLHITRGSELLVAPGADLAEVGGVLRAMTLDRAAPAVMRAEGAGDIDVMPTHKVVSDANYSLTITVMLPEPHRTRAHWPCSDAVEAYLSPLLRQLEGIHLTMAVRCQQLYMTPLTGVKPQWQERLQHYSVPQQQLPHAINAIEAKLGSFVSTSPALHFVVYVPAQEHTPLHIHGANGEGPLPSNSFVVPRWGGVIIHNPPSKTPAVDRQVDLPAGGDNPEVLQFFLDTHFVMTSVLTQLHVLLPIPQIPPSPSVGVAPADSPRLSQWQLDGLARARVTQYYRATGTTLQSLHELVGEISNMVVSDEVGGWVWQSVEEWEACGEAAERGMLGEASLHCTAAHHHAQAAFFHPSMLALLYFPDNQKYAIYVPLFLPVSIPVLQSFKMLYRLLRSHMRRAPRQKTD